MEYDTSNLISDRSKMAQANKDIKSLKPKLNQLVLNRNVESAYNRANNLVLQLTSRRMRG